MRSSNERRNADNFFKATLRSTDVLVRYSQQVLHTMGRAETPETAAIYWADFDATQTLELITAVMALRERANDGDSEAAQQFPRLWRDTTPYVLEALTPQEGAIRSGAGRSEDILAITTLQSEYAAAQRFNYHVEALYDAVIESAFTHYGLPVRVTEYNEYSGEYEFDNRRKHSPRSRNALVAGYIYDMVGEPLSGYHAEEFLRQVRDVDNLPAKIVRQRASLTHLQKKENRQQRTRQAQKLWDVAKRGIPADFRALR
jgi:hypothetical protein